MVSPAAGAGAVAVAAECEGAVLPVFKSSVAHKSFILGIDEQPPSAVRHAATTTTTGPTRILINALRTPRSGRSPAPNGIEPSTLGPGRTAPDGQS